MQQISNRGKDSRLIIRRYKLRSIREHFIFVGKRDLHRNETFRAVYMSPTGRAGPTRREIEILLHPHA